MIDRLERQIEKEARDLDILETVVHQHPIGIVRLSEETGVPQHKVRYSLRMLENDGLIEPTQQGATPASDIEDRLADINEGLESLAERLRALED